MAEGNGRGGGRGGSSKGSRGSWRGGGGGGRFFGKSGNSSGGAGQIPKGDAISVQHSDMTWMNFLSIKDYKDSTTLPKLKAAKTFISSQNVKLNVNRGYFSLNYKACE